jgi:hypothetical protein
MLSKSGIAFLATRDFIPAIGVRFAVRKSYKSISDFAFAKNPIRDHMFVVK